MPSDCARYNLLVAFFRRLPLNHSLDFHLVACSLLPQKPFHLSLIFALATLRRLIYRAPSNLKTCICGLLIPLLFEVRDP